MEIRASMLVLGIGLALAIAVAGYGLDQAIGGVQAPSHPLPRLVVTR